MAETLTKLVYQTSQWSKSIFSVAHKALGAQAMNLLAPEAKPETEPWTPELAAIVQRRMQQLLDQDWHDAEQGVYPESLLFDDPWDDYALNYPLVWLDMTQIWERITGKRHQEFGSGIRTEGYPNYYVQNFHFQTDGYLSEQSANLYDLQVELLFNGTADAMRRRVLAPLSRGLSAFDIPPYQIRVLDVACGTGRTLRMIRKMLSQAALYGTDLSPTYLRKANQLLSRIPGELPQLIQANAEELPYLDNYFHGITSVFLFHELPPEARQHVIEQCFRVLQPGGVFVICDSIQMSDSPELEVAMRNFPAMFHEPYYRHYTTDDLTARLEKAGFVPVEPEIHFMSKYWVARKPA
ncbi:MAG TPA: methyltransferase domain-containing protein [Trichocoleus sp.]|jgi:ubiquinone/menaquinone biosynthesis C-methylase UbiE